MKKLSGLIITIVVLVLLYTVFWFYQAHQVKKLFLYHLNEYEKPDDQGYYVKVDDVSVHGYPFNYVVNLSHPRYEKKQDPKDSAHYFKVALDGIMKIGTDIFGKSYWIKQEGDLNYLPGPEEKEAKRYVVKGNMKLKVDVAHPQYARALMHPFSGLPEVFYKENPSFQELLSELKMASYEDHDFGMYEIDANTSKQLVGFSKGNIRWNYGSKGQEEEKFVLNLELKDFEATENGQPLLPHLKKLMDLSTDATVDVPYILGSGKNNIALDFEAIIPQNFDGWKFFNYKNLDITLKKLEMDNLYGHTTASFDMNLKEKEQDSRNLRLTLSANSIITEKGSEAIHRQFIEGLKQNVAAHPEDEENKVINDLLKCCEERLQDIIPDYTRLGKMRFLFDMDIKVKNVSKNPILDKLILNNLDAMAEPYGIKSHGEADFANDQPRGKYEIDWINFKQMIHDIIAYYNRIHPIFEKFSKANHQSLPVDVITTAQKEIVDFFKSISNDPSKDNNTITITVDFSDINNPKIGQNNLEQVKQAWDKLVADIVKKEAPSPKPAKPSEPNAKEEKSVKS